MNTNTSKYDQRKQELIKMADYLKDVIKTFEDKDCIVAYRDAKVLYELMKLRIYET